MKKEWTIGIDEVGWAARTKKRASPKYVIGIDEVGRGPLAGRVFVCSLLLPNDWKNKYSKSDRPNKLTDSKKLTEKQREDWYKWVIKNNIKFKISSASWLVVDKINISNACNLCATRSFGRLIKNENINSASIIADGSIKTRISKKGYIYKSFPKADELIPAVSLASIVAKVRRDKEMKKLAKIYPKYGFDIHKGYGTKKHIDAIKKHGICEIHRRSFVKGIVKSSK